MNRSGEKCECGRCREWDALTGIQRHDLERFRDALPTGLANREYRPFSGEMDEEGCVRFHPCSFDEEVDNLRVHRLFMWGIGAVEGEIE